MYASRQQSAGRRSGRLRDCPGAARPRSITTVCVLLASPNVHWNLCASVGLPCGLWQTHLRTGYGAGLDRQSQLEIEQAPFTHPQGGLDDRQPGKKAAQNEIAMIKIAVPQVHTNVVNRAIQLFGGAGVSDDFRWPPCGRNVAPCISWRSARCTNAPCQSGRTPTGQIM